MTEKSELPECQELGCEKHNAHKKGCPLTDLEIKLYLKHGYFGGVARYATTKGGITRSVAGINYWQSPLR